MNDPVSRNAAVGESSSRRFWEISEHGAKVLLVLMFVVKVGVTAWNARAYDQRPYDFKHHLGRAFTGGLVLHKMNYDPPLYYLPALLYRQVLERTGVEAPPPTLNAWTEASSRPALRVMYLLRVTNVIYAALFYACWCFFSFPRLLPDWRSAFLASALLLSMPGYQKLAAMTHADNLFAASAALCTVVWLQLHARYLERGPELEARYWLALAVAAGVVGLSRPFAVVPVVLFALVAATFALRARRIAPARAAGRLLAIGALAGTLAFVWYALRWHASSAVLDAYKAAYIKRWSRGREDYDFVHYFTSFSLPQLLLKPNRFLSGTGGFEGNDSFFTVLYSEIWGDHWLYFSGKNGIEGKLLSKRILFVLALPVVPLLLLGAWRSLRAWRERAREALAPGMRSGLQRLRAALAANERQAVIAVWLIAAAGLFLYWQTGPALLPSKNSTIKFTYTATFYPLAIALAGYRPSRWSFNATAYYLLALFAGALPVAIFSPG